MEQITKSEWRSLPKDYKTIIDGQRHILKLVNGGTCLVPVKVVKDEEENNGTNNKK